MAQTVRDLKLRHERITFQTFYKEQVMFKTIIHIAEESSHRIHSVEIWRGLVLCLLARLGVFVSPIQTRLSDANSCHEATKVGMVAQEQLVVVSARIWTVCYTGEAVQVELPLETFKSVRFEESIHDFLSKSISRTNTKGSAFHFPAGNHF